MLSNATRLKIANYLVNRQIMELVENDPLSARHGLIPSLKMGRERLINEPEKSIAIALEIGVDHQEFIQYSVERIDDIINQIEDANNNFQ